MTIELDYFEYANDAAVQAAYVSSDTAATTTITQSQTSEVDDHSFNTTELRYSEGFKVATVDNISKFTWKLTNIGSATGTLTGYIYSDNAGVPNASVATFSNMNVATISASPTFTAYDFTGSFTPTANTQYHMVLIWTSAGGTGIGLRRDSADSYADGAPARWNGSSWDALTLDVYFLLYQDIIHLQDYSESTIKTQGSYSLKGIAAITDSLNDTLTRTVSPTINLTGQIEIKFDLYSSRTGSNIKIGIHDSGGTTTEKTHTVSTADTWETDTWDISAVASANKDAIDQIIITITNADASNTFYVDNMYALPFTLRRAMMITD